MSGIDEKEENADDDQVEVCNLGVSVTYLMNFAKTVVDQQWTTTDVCVKHVLPETKGEGKAYYELIKDETDEKGNKVVGDADYFCSHAWRYKFVNVVNALEVFCNNQRLKPENTYIWFDLFINNQHKAPNLSYKWWCGRFKEAIASFGKVVLILEPWTDPIPITRAWCLWEIYCTIDTKSEFNVAMCEAEHKDFRLRLVRNFEDIRTSLSKIDARRADAWNKKDRDKIFAAIEEGVGFARLNESVIGKMRDWLKNAGEAHLKQTIEDCGSEDLQTLQTYNCLGKVYRDMNDYSKAEELFTKALEGFAKTTGEDSEHTSEVKNNLAFSLQKQGKLEAAIEMHESCLKSRLNKYGDLHKDTTQSMSNLATALRRIGQLERAKTMFKRAVKCRDDIASMGPSHPATLYTVSQYALTLSKCKDFDEAKQQHLRAIDGMDRFFSKLVPNGRKHPLTLLAIHNMGHHYMLMEQYTDAMEKLLEAYNGRLEKLGEKAKETNVTKDLLDQVFTALKDAGKQPRLVDLSAKHVEAYLREKKERRKLWQRASNYLSFKANLGVRSMWERDFGRNGVGEGITDLLEE